jgi:hypothetical protein
MEEKDLEKEEENVIEEPIQKPKRTLNEKQREAVRINLEKGQKALAEKRAKQREDKAKQEEELKKKKEQLIVKKAEKIIKKEKEVKKVLDLKEDEVDEEEIIITKKPKKKRIVYREESDSEEEVIVKPKPKSKPKEEAEPKPVKPVAPQPSFRIHFV